MTSKLKNVTNSDKTALSSGDGATPRRMHWAGHLAFGLGGVLLFYLALGVMKAGSHALTPLFQDVLAVTNSADSLGLGWLMATVVQSGSPVAAVATAMLSAGTLSSEQGFMMIAGSRLGASLVVLQVGFLYALRQRDRWSSLTAGVLSLLLTGSTFVLTIPMGLLLVRQGWLASIDVSGLLHWGAGLAQGVDWVIAPLVRLLPGWALFVLGTGAVVLSFELFDRALPEFNLEQTGFNLIHRLVYRPTLMFLIGFLFTFITMSVSVSVGLLVPLSVRGYMRRENIMAYILGANISTFVDTLFAAILLGDAAAVVVVLAHMLCAACVSLAIVLFGYRHYERLISRALDWITLRKRNFAIFLAMAFVLPLVLILL